MRLYLLVIVVLFSLNSNGQQIVRSTLGSVGNTSTKDGVILKQTVGQPSNTTTISTESGILRQGFQQPTRIDGQVYTSSPIQFSVYPNPAVESTTVVVDEDISNYTLLIERLDGGVISKKSNLNSKRQYIDLTDYASGVYFFRLIYEDRVGIKKIIVNATYE